MTRFLFVVLVWGGVAWGQISSNTARHFVYGTSLPATCNYKTGDVYALVGPSSTTYNCCTAANTWGSCGAGGGGSGTVTSIGLVGTANQITVTGASPITSSGSWTLSIPTNPTLPGTTTGLFNGTIADSATGAMDSPARPLIAAHVTSATPIEVDTGYAGFSAGLQTQMTNASGSTVPAMYLDCLWRDPTVGDQTCAVVLRSYLYDSILPIAIFDDWNGNYFISANQIDTRTRNTVAIGFSACSNSSTGSENTCIGNGSQLANGTDTNSIVLGAFGGFANTIGAGSNTAVIGNVNITDVFLGSATGSAINHPNGTQDKGTAFASLGTPSNGKFLYCTDCTVTSGIDNTCAGSGTGAFAVRLAGAWKCEQ